METPCTSEDEEIRYLHNIYPVLIIFQCPSHLIFFHYAYLILVGIWAIKHLLGSIFFRASALIFMALTIELS